MLILYLKVSKFSMKLHLVVEIEHRQKSFQNQACQKLDQKWIEKYRFSEKPISSLLNYQKWFLVLNTIILYDFQIKFRISSTFVPIYGSEMWNYLKFRFLIQKCQIWSKNARGSPRNWTMMEIFVKMILVSHSITLCQIWATYTF